MYSTSPPPPVSPPGASGVASARVLVVDDERSVLSALRRALSRFGCNVICAESGEAALEVLARLAHTDSRPQVVLSDHRMLHMDGVTFLTQVKANWPDIQRVLITGFADLDAIERAVNEAGIYRFLNKPWEDLSLLSTVRSAVEQWSAAAENQRLMEELAGHNRRLEEAVAARTVELREAHRLLTRTFDAIFEPLMVIDENYRIVRANRALSAHLDVRSSDPPLGQVCHELRAASRWRLKRSDAGPCAGCPAQATRMTSAPSEAELVCDEGSLVLKTFPLDSLTVCVYRDVTRQRETAQKLALTDRLAAIGQLAGGVAHELNNPLSGVLAFTQLLRRGVSSRAEQEEFLREIESASLRCKCIIEHLLRFSRQAQRDDVSRLDLNAMIHDTLPLVERQYALRGVRIVCHLCPELPDIVGSTARLQQVLMNLLSNAFDATHKARAGEKGAIFIHTAWSGTWVSLSVRDQGTGIDENSIAHLFLPFFTTKPEGRGAGLGLAVAYGIVSDHGGTIQARNLPEGGAEFVVTLPAA